MSNSTNTMSASALVFLWTGGLILGSAVMISVVVRRAIVARGPVERAGPPSPGGQEARAERLRNLLLSRMSHDLRSPLNSIITLTELLRQGNVGPLSIDQRRYVDVIRHSGQTLLALINDILDLAAVESGRVELERAVIDLSALVRTVAESSSAIAGEKGIPVHVSAPADPLAAEADGDHLRKILQRLVEHAVTEAWNGYVEIVVARGQTASTALLRVHETAGTLTDAERRAVSQDGDDFEDYIAGTDRFAERGPAALPLVVAARLAKLMGLHIKVDVSPTDGVSFGLELPLASAPAPTTGASAGAAEGPGSPALGPAAGQILLIEDDSVERQRVRDLLEASGYRVTLAASGEEGLALLRREPFDAVVLDLVMPGMSGLDVLRVARGDDRLADLPFVVLSALYMTKSERAVLGPRVASVVRKGDMTGEELSLSLRRALKSPPSEARAIPGGDGVPPP